ncbi:MAG: hypothetical protein KGJ23_11785 [Euryarchaeota archaeon]|nr:hypothetical protein [Euryarchaeota archaeon]MDE1837276.1 hypothetical protein [Euryarchaeota archaeon]MDE1879946.1 hypothetical protein [Euryarchaeota archaeon]MDE2045120.1 hypothetical protein [Thermoplasmata archaeon]
MTRYDTTAQARLRASSRRLNLVLAGVLLGVATWLLVGYILQSLSPYPPYTTFQVLLAILVYCIAAVPLSQAFLRRPHPESVETRDDALVLRFRKGEPIRIAWEDRPVSMAYDDRELRGGRGRSPGMEVVVYVPLPGREEGTETFRPMELDLSAQAFDDVKKRMKGAGFKVRSRPWGRRRPGKMVEFLRKGDPSYDEPEPLPEPALRASGGAPGPGSRPGRRWEPERR